MKLRTPHLAAPLFLLLLWGAVPGQAQSRKQAELERKLTQRVEQFYKLFVSGEWRKVEPFLTKDSKDIWLTLRKGTIDSFQVQEVQVAPGGEEADVTVSVTFRIPQAPTAPFTQPQKSKWLYQNKKWFIKLQRPPSMLELFKSVAPPSPSKPAPSPAEPDQNPIAAPPSLPEPGSEATVE